MLVLKPMRGGLEQERAGVERVGVGVPARLLGQRGASALLLRKAQSPPADHACQ